MAGFRCMNHPDRQAVHQCARCGKPLCEECYDSDLGRCRENCAEPLVKPQPKGRSAAFRAIVAILAIIGALTVLLAAICGAYIFSLS
ncbi:hypothetical protein SAMN04487895_102352 [Paenibacillus sophorae]|uniref:B box-type domain-containing protein n=2 Tax=Paenibacillus sophorae TaxID=1333845 RepID=A0A1H8IWX8_9BACL|nr:hypothetical protein KP014_02155 [Paenibacillus sophorae]SEN72546.1 hypothetical protein SAMN04487895_102352 [Paenibacillus sophorae]